MTGCSYHIPQIFKRCTFESPILPSLCHPTDTSSHTFPIIDHQLTQFHLKHLWEMPKKHGIQAVIACIAWAQLRMTPLLGSSKSGSCARMMRECQPSCLRFNEILRVSCFLSVLHFPHSAGGTAATVNAGIAWH